jgi:hypothetical protein
MASHAANVALLDLGKHFPPWLSPRQSCDYIALRTRFPVIEVEK